jgi:hypothetical protein
MGIFKKHQGKGVRLTFSLHIHTLSWPIGAGSLCVRFERGSHKGSTRAVEPAVKGGHAIYAFEEQLTLPATLFQVRCRRTFTGVEALSQQSQEPHHQPCRM